MSAPGARAIEAASNERANHRLFHHSLYPTERVAAARRRRGLTVSVCLPARECAGTVGEIVRRLLALREAGALNEVVVVDAASPDGTAAVAERAGARVYQEAQLLPHVGPVLGKGDAMWRALSVLGGDVICFLDADTEDFSAHFAIGMLGPLLCERGVSFVKGHYRRPLSPAAGAAATDGGGRVNHLTARPALALFYPELAVVRQPLAGETAGRRALLQRLAFTTGYGVEIGLLIDVWRRLGLAAIAQVDLDEHRNRHQPLAALSPMALAVLATIAVRLQREGRLSSAPHEDHGAALHLRSQAPVERPPLAGASV
ncbi:MAG TPA: glucosyl-3-phosphoglycerate synthase [Solirubrobacteraceae bacterium]|jgi:glucosyl-3-phosphoglycerate synthase|nr:glucosyl-3-phosphoglycerate synthase [Solirubrobacteraceae bacterium]